MSEQDNVALLQRGFEAFNQADIQTLSEIFADDAVQHMPGKSVFGGDWKGRDEILGMYGRLGEATAGTFRATLQELAADGPEHVVAKYRAQATKDGATLDRPRTIVFTVNDGKIVDVVDNDDDVAVFDAFFA